MASVTVLLQISDLEGYNFKVGRAALFWLWWWRNVWMGTLLPPSALPHKASLWPGAWKETHSHPVWDGIHKPCVVIRLWCEWLWREGWLNRYNGWDDHKDDLLSALGSLSVSIRGLLSTGAHYYFSRGGGKNTRDSLLVSHSFKKRLRLVRDL